MVKLDKLDILLIKLDILLINDINSILYKKSIDLYEKTFPNWEREPSHIIAEKIKSEKVFLIVATTSTKNEVFSMALLEKYEKSDSILFTYLAVKEKLRGLGIGSKMVITIQEAFNVFFKEKYLFIEAEQRQAELYSRLNFFKLSFDYFSPSFEKKSESIKMHLMVFNRRKLNKFFINKNFIRKFIKELFLNGYFLKSNDKRLNSQLNIVEGYKLIKARKLKKKDKI